MTQLRTALDEATTSIGSRAESRRRTFIAYKKWKDFWHTHGVSLRFGVADQSQRDKDY